MAIIAGDRILAVQLSQTISAKRTTITMHYGADSPPGVDDGEELEIAWRAQCLAVFEAAVSVDVFFEQIYVHGVVPGVCKPGLNQLYAEQGVVAGEALPENVGVCFQIRQYETSSKHNNRFYLPGLVEDECINGLVDAGSISGTLNDIAVAIATPIVLAGGRTYSLVCLSRFNAGVPIAPEGYLAAAVVPTRSMASQRRRTTQNRAYT